MFKIKIQRDCQDYYDVISLMIDRGLGEYVWEYRYACSRVERFKADYMRMLRYEIEEFIVRMT